MVFYQFSWIYRTNKNILIAGNKYYLNNTKNTFMKKHHYLLLALPVLFACNSNSDAPVARKEVKQYSAEQLYNNKSISGAAFNADETRILTGANISGIINLYELSIADTSMKALTKSVKESFFPVDYLPGSSRYIYSADQGGNENSHLYLQSPGDTVAKDITPWIGSANSLFSWSADKKSVFVTSNKRNPKYFDVWKADTATWNFTPFYQNDSGYDVNDISKSERYIALTRAITTDKNELYLYDSKTKTTKRLSNDNEATWNATGFEKNDSIMYYITNDGNEFSYIVKYNINSGATQKIYSTNWDAGGMSLSENEKYHTIFINEDGKNKILLFDHATNKPVDFPEIKDGDVKGVIISPSEKNMLLTVGSSRSPDNLYSYNFDNKTLKQLTQTLNKEVDVNDLVSAEVVRFKSFDGKEIPAIYYKPLTASKDHKVPAMLWIHGGPGGQTRIGFSNAIQHLVNHGYAVLAVNNRGSSGYGKSFYKMDNRDHSNGDLKDCVWGKKWLQQQDYIDTAKIGIEGGSYGGCMVLGALAFHPDEFKVGVDLFGVANWIRTLRSIPPYWESFKKALYEEMGDPNTADSVRLKNISPLYNYQKINKPLIVFQGLNDVRVLPIESKEIFEGVKKNNVPVEYVSYPNEGHGFTKKENQITTANKTLEFLDKYLKGEGFTPNKKM
jgi:dipeptidyl aminopeptidase/acylaminoacyl peptidase